MFDLNCRFQIAALCVLLLIVIDYCKNIHLKLLSTACFRAMLWVAFINLALDLTTVYTISHLYMTPLWLNRLCHQLFIASVLLVGFFIYLYIRLLSNDQKRISAKELAVTLLPMLVSLAFILFAPLSYHVDVYSVYSYGPMAYAVYICSGIYLFLGFFFSLDKRSALNRDQRLSLYIGLSICFATLLTQMVFPRLLISGMGFVLLILANYFSFESQRENRDVETDCFNKSAFHRMMSEHYEGGRAFTLVNLSCMNLDQINRVMGHQAGAAAMLYLKDTLEDQLHLQVFHSRSKTLSVFSSETPDELFARLQGMEASLTEEAYPAARLRCCIDVLDVHRYTNTKDEVYELMSYLEELPLEENFTLRIIDQSLIDSKNRRDQLESLVARALENDGFEMYYQPIYCTKHQRFESAEALIRLKDTGGLGFVSPEEFIPIAEEKGLIMDIGDRALELVAKFVREADLVHSPLHYIEVNLSAIQAIAPQLPQRLQSILEKHETDASFINLEITETATVTSGAAFARNMDALRADGFSFSMDDFGTGYSNLSQMNKMRYDLVKMDKSLIWPAFAPGGEAAMELMDSIIDLLKSTQVRIVAEGVETKEMADHLQAHGVDYLQGYYYSRPIPKDAFLNFYLAHAAV